MRNTTKSLFIKKNNVYAVVCRNGCKSRLLSLKTEEKEIEKKKEKCVCDINTFYDQLIGIINKYRNKDIDTLNVIEKNVVANYNNYKTETKNFQQKLLLCKDECNNIIYHSNLNDTAENRKKRLKKVQNIVNKANIISTNIDNIGIRAMSIFTTVNLNTIFQIEECLSGNSGVTVHQEMKDGSNSSMTITTKGSFSMATVPFIQLFIIQRLLNRNSKAKNVSFPFSANKNDQKHGEIAASIINNLSQLGLHGYMKDRYNEQHSDALSLLFKNMIHEYPNEYQSIMSCQVNYHSNNISNNNNNSSKDRYYESQVFNQSDLIPKTFQFLFFEDVNKCCLVNSIWLYHGYNINSIAYVNTYIWLQHEKNQNKFVNARKRVWKRWINARKFWYYNSDRGSSVSNEFLNGFALLQNIEFIDITLAKYTSDMEEKFVELIGKHARKYVNFSLDVFDKKNTIDPLKVSTKSSISLYNAKTILLRGLTFPILFTNKCEKLTLSQIQNVTYEWCNHLIENCDLSNIKFLRLDDIQLNFGKNKQDITGAINEIASKLINLKYFAVQSLNDDMLIFWKALKSIIKKNSVVLEMDTRLYGFRYGIQNSKREQLFKTLLQFISEHKFESQIKRLVLVVNDQLKKGCLKLLNVPKAKKTIEKLSVIPGNESSFSWIFSLTTDKQSKQSSFFRQDEKEFDLKDKFKQLKVLRIPYSLGRLNLKTLVEFLQIKLSKNAYFVDINMDIKFETIDSVININRNEDQQVLAFEKNFEKLLNIVSQMIEKQIPLNIKIVFRQYHPEGITKDKKKANQVAFAKYNDQLFEPLFGTEKLKSMEIQVSKCDQHWKQVFPKFEFVCNDVNIMEGEQYINVGHLQIQTANEVDPWL